VIQNSYYRDYAKIYHEVVDLSRTLNTKKRELDALTIELSKDGKFGLELSSHAQAQISERLEDLTSDNQIIYYDVFRPESQQDALIIPSNLKSFVFSLLSKALDEETVEKKSSRSGGTEYHHNTVIKKWVSGKKVIQFTGIVENGIIKTGFFNYVDSNDGKK
jgi:hypothetical protein